MMDQTRASSPTHSAERRVAMAGPGSIWFFLAIIVVPSAIVCMTVAPLNWRADLFALFGIAVLVKAMGLVNRKIFLTDRAIIVRNAFASEKIYQFDEVRSLRFGTIWNGRGQTRAAGASIYVESSGHTLHFVVAATGVLPTLTALIGLCKNAVIIDDDNGTLNLPQNDDPASPEQLRSYARRMVTRHALKNGMWTTLVISLIAAICLRAQEVRQFGPWATGSLICVAWMIVLAIFAVREHRFARRLIRKWG